MDLSSEKVLKLKGGKMEWVDYVLVYKTCAEEEDPILEEEKSTMRQRYVTKLTEKGLWIQEMRDKTSNLTLVLIQASFDTLCAEAERLALRMPIDVKTDYEDEPGCWEHFQKRYLVTDDEEDFLSATFVNSNKLLYKDFDKGDHFFRPALRFFMTYTILINTDISENSDGSDRLQALQYLLHRKVYSDHFMPHSPSKLSKYFLSFQSGHNENNDDIWKERKPLVIDPDEREQLHEEWISKLRYQPLWRIRNYFGEKAAFYFAWSGHMVFCLWGPTLVGLVVFIYGLYLTITKSANLNFANATSDLIRVQLVVDNMLNTVKQSFDNTLTPIFAGIICVWGTIFTETWKRLSNKLSFEWDVSSFDETEPERPEFIGTNERKDPVTNYMVKYFPASKQGLRFLGSVAILMAMLLVVFAAVIAVIIYRVVITVNVCPGTTSINCLILNMVVSSVLNAVAIIALGKVYDKVAVILTDWENHRTQSQYDNALIFKLFSFQFVNSYSSLFYIAFFKGKSGGILGNGIFNMGPKYVDTCGVDNNCMAMLSFQVLTLMIMKPLPKLLTDVFIPFIQEKINSCKKSKSVTPDARKKNYKNVKYYLLSELDKPVLGDFTIGEYMEKVIQYGYLVLFSASFPLAPLLALLTNCFDLKVDSYRLLWTFRRCIPEIVQDIGIWQSIVETLNLLGVVSTAFIVAFTSSWGQTLSVQDKLIFVIVVEHGLLLIKYILNVLIPDVPQSVIVNMRREKFHFHMQKVYHLEKEADGQQNY